MNDDSRSIKIKLLDLLGVTRKGSEALLAVRDANKRYEWIRCGCITLQGHRGGPWTLAARAREGVTDMEHDSAYIFQIPLVGVELESSKNGWTCITGWISGEPWDLRVPTDPNYDPTKVPDAKTCNLCEEAHPIIPPEYWAGPPADHNLWQQLVGRKLEVRFGPVKDE